MIYAANLCHLEQLLKLQHAESRWVLSSCRASDTAKPPFWLLRVRQLGQQQWEKENGRVSPLRNYILAFLSLSACVEGLYTLGNLPWEVCCDLLLADDADGAKETCCKPTVTMVTLCHTCSMPRHW